MMDHNSKVSIVIPTFNRCDKLKYAIDASLSQTFPCEVIVVDHGSSDDTPNVVSTYGEEVVYIRKDVDFGPHYAWLDGVIHAKGEYIHIQYDDDWIAPTFIEECMGLFNEEVGMTFCNADVVNLDSGDVSFQFNFLPEVLESSTYGNDILEKELLGRINVISPAACIFRKVDVIDALYQGEFPVKGRGKYHGVGPDLFMSLITLIRYDYFGYVNKSLAFFGAHDGSITIDASLNEQNNDMLMQSYDAVKVQYLALKDVKDKYSMYEEDLQKIKRVANIRFFEGYFSEPTSVDIGEVPRGIDIAVYGTGNLSRKLQEYLTFARPDLNIVLLLDSFKEDISVVPRIKQPQNFNNECDIIIIASSYVNEVMANLKKHKIEPNPKLRILYALL